MLQCPLFNKKPQLSLGKAYVRRTSGRKVKAIFSEMSAVSYAIERYNQR